MLFLFLWSLVDDSAPRADKSYFMLAAMLVLIGILLWTAWLVWKKRGKWMIAAWFALFLLALPQIFAFSTFLEWEDQSVAPEYLGRLDLEPSAFAEYFPEGENGFTLTGTPPSGTCGWGDVPLEKLPSELAEQLKRSYQIDCEQYSYLITRGVRNPRLEYSVWSNGAWYLGPKGFWRSFDGAKLLPSGDFPREDDPLYIFRFPRKYLALRSEPIESGSLTYFFVQVSW